MASTYYDSSGKSVIDGDIAYAADLNDINSAVDTALQQVETDITAIAVNQPYYSNLAQKWAEEVEDTPVTAGHYSALHWAAKAEDQAILADADRVQTNNDKLATAADRVATNNDKIATAADRVQTGLDRVATAADRVQTGLDAATTAQDVIDTQALVNAFPTLASGDEGKYLKVDNPFSNGYVVSTLDLTGYAPLSSPTFTGVPAAPTATAGTETTQLATTKYVIDTAQRRLTAVSGLNNEGEVIGFDMTSMTGNALTFSKGSCLDSILKVPIVFTSNKTVTLASTNNAEFFIFAVRLIDTVTFEARAYTTYAGPASDAQIDSWRFIGYAKNNGSGVTFPHVMVDGVIDFTTLSSTAAPLITSTMTTSYVEYTLSTVVDMTVLRELWICSTASGCNLFASYAGSADISPASAAFTPIVLLPRSSIYLKYSNNNGPAVVKRVKLRR